MNKVCRCHKEKIRTEKEHKLLTNRLKRIEGQVRGIIKMVDENAYCPDILIQVSAIKSALDSFNKELLSEHIRTCVTEDIKKGNTEITEKLADTINKLMK